MAALRAAKLRFLVRGQWPEVGPDLDQTVLPGGAFVWSDVTRRAWALVDGTDGRGLGPAMIKTARCGAGRLDVLVDGGSAPSGAIARQADQFLGCYEAWAVHAGALSRAAPATVELDTYKPPGAAAFAEVLSERGIEPVLEHGVLRGEILGLEVARVVEGPAGPLLEVGVGQQDRWARRELGQSMFGIIDSGDEASRSRAVEELTAALDYVRTVVRRWRAPGQMSHPANILVRERWLRAVIIAHPEIVGAHRLSAMPSPWVRRNLLETFPAVASGVDPQGRGMVVVCSTGIDLDLVPMAADARLFAPVPSRMVIVVPTGDDHPANRSLAAALKDPAEIVVVPKDWPRLAPSV